jgi:hypothetical protein
MIILVVMVVVVVVIVLVKYADVQILSPTSNNNISAFFFLSNSFIFSIGSRRFSFTTTDVHKNEMTGILHVDIELIHYLSKLKKKKKS